MQRIHDFCWGWQVLLGQVHRLDTVRLERWVLRRHMALEGGFSGRANKLVDGCYSFWQGGLLPLLMPLV